MRTEIGSYEAKTKLPELLRQVKAGKAARRAGTSWRKDDRNRSRRGLRLTREDSSRRYYRSTLSRVTERAQTLAVSGPNRIYSMYMECT